MIFKNYGQVTNFKKNDSENILIKINSIKKLIQTDNIGNHFLALRILKKTETELKSRKDTASILLFHRESINLIPYIQNFGTPNAYLLENFKILKKYKDNRELALLYEALGDLRYYQGDKKMSHKYDLEAQKLLKKHGTVEDNIDINYNLSFYYKDNLHSYQKAIDYAMLSLKNIKRSKSIEKNNFKIPNLYLVISDSYAHLERLDSVFKYLTLIDKDHISVGKGRDPYYAKFFELKANYYYKKGNMSKASDLYQISIKEYQKLSQHRINIIRKSDELSSALKFKNLEYQKQINENRLVSINEVYKNYLLFFGSIIIIILFILIIIQFNLSKYKTNVNLILKNKNKELKAINKDLKEALKVKRNFLDTVTHELKTPLNTIKGITYLLEKEDSKERKTEYLKNLNFSSDYLLGFINYIIEYKTLKKQDFIKLQNRETNLKNLLVSIVEMFKVKNDNDNKINLHFDEAIPEILKIDTIKLTQVIVSLMANATKFTKNGEVILKAELVNSENDKVDIRFYVSDNGIGISKNAQSKIFEPFVQESKQINRNYGGSGLGLSIIKKTLELFHSDIQVKSEKNKGSTFSFIIDFDVIKKNKNQDKLEIEKKGKKRSSNIEVLLVEDNKINQSLTKKILIDNGFQCDVANNGVEAVNMTTTKNYNIILMDIMMPIMNGFEASKIINDLKPEIPIVALTAISEDITSSAFQKSKILEKLDKPINVDTLFKTIFKYVI